MDDLSARDEKNNPVAGVSFGETVRETSRSDLSFGERAYHYVTRFVRTTAVYPNGRANVLASVRISRPRPFARAFRHLPPPAFCRGCGHIRTYRRLGRTVTLVIYFGGTKKIGEGRPGLRRVSEIVVLAVSLFPVRSSFLGRARARRAKIPESARRDSIIPRVHTSSPYIEEMRKFNDRTGPFNKNYTRNCGDCNVRRFNLRARARTHTRVPRPRA